MLVAQLSLSQELSPFKNKEIGIVNIGIDYTRTTFIGESGFPSSQELLSKYIPEWNRKLRKESDKFDFQKMLRHRKYKFDVDPMNKHNEKHVDTEAMIKEYVPDELTKEDLAAMVKSYEDVDDEFPVAMVWIPESYNSKENKALVHLVFFNVSTREIIWTKELVGRPNGFGVKNFWLNTFKSFVKKIKIKYPKWCRE